VSELAGRVLAHRTADSKRSAPAGPARGPASEAPLQAGSIGNQANQTALRLARAELGGPNDREEHEAEAFASRSLGMTVPPRDGQLREPGPGQSSLRRAPATSSSEAAVAPPGFSGGRSLPLDLRHFFEPRLGRDLGDVRLHTDVVAAASASRLGARAYAQGSNIAFARGQYRPQTQEGRRLIAHELAHVRQSDRGRAKIRRDGDPTATPTPAPAQAQPPAPAQAPAPDPAAAPAIGDEDAKLLEQVKNFPADWSLNSARQHGGLTGWKTNYPQSFEELRAKAVGVIGNAAFERLLRQDSEILALVQKSAQIIEGLQKLKAEVAEKPAASSVVGYYQGYLGERGFYEFDYSYFAVTFKEDPQRSIEPLKWLLSGDVEQIIDNVRQSAGLAQADEDALQAQRDAWKADGESVLGTKVAEKQRTLWWNAELHLATLLAPEYGDEDADQMLALARMTGRSTAVLKVKERYYAYMLDKQYDREDLFLLPDKDSFVEVIPAGPLTGSVVAITATSGFVLRPPTGDGELYRTGDEVDNPLKRLEADTKLLESGKAKAAGLAPIDIFQSMLMNLALLNLQQAENRLRDIRKSHQDEGIFQATPNAAAGDKLKRDTARLRSLTIELNNLAVEIEDKGANDEQGDQRDALLTEAGQIVTNNPGAALFVENKRDPESKDPADESDVENKLGDKGGKDAAEAAVDEAQKRLDNIAAVRRAIFDEPTRVLDFDILYEPVMARFNDDDKSSIKTSLFFHGLDKFASIVRIAAIDLGLLLAGFITGGETWIGLAVHGAGLAFGAYQLRQQAAEATLVGEEAALDVEGGFQLATGAQARSARRWFYVSVGLNVLAVFGFARAVRTFLQEGSREATLLARFAARVGVSEEVMAAALRRNWRGGADPDPAALQKILLSSLDPELARAYENRNIVKLLSDAEWLQKYPNSAAQAKLVVLSKGPTPEIIVEFRKSGSILSLEEEAQHIQQAADPKWASKITATQDIAKTWSTLSDAAKLQAWRDTLEVEIDVQQRLLQRAELIGDTEAADDAFAQVEELSGRLREAESGLADGKLPSWFDPTAPPGVFSTPRLPRVGRGRWSGTPGNSIWYPGKDENEILGVIGKGNGVRYRNGYPDFSPWSRGQVNLGGMSGEADDFSEADKLFAQGVMNRTRDPPTGFTREQFIYNGKPNASTTKAYRQTVGLTWHHHQGGKLMLLVPTDLHANVPHTGGASAARAAGP
jgi:hypothetical protein